jgi:predicted ribonuclease YlaK
MGGRTIANSFIVIDEVHLFSKNELLFLMTRPDSLSKFVGIGDPNQLDSADIDEIRKKHLSPNQTGISHFIEDYKITPSEKTLCHDSSVAVLSIMGEEYVYRSLIAQIAETWRNF